MANWYVSQKVASSGAGTSLSVAFKTIAEAITASASNDTIFIYEGVYNEGNFNIGKNLTFRGVGFVDINGGSSFSYFTQISLNNTVLQFYNLKVSNYLVGTFRSAQVSGTYKFYNIVNIGDILLPALYGANLLNIFEKCILINTNMSIINGITSQNGIYYYKITFINSTIIGTYTRVDAPNRRCYFIHNLFYNSNLNSHYTQNLLITDFIYNNFHNSSVKFLSTKSYSPISSISDIITKYNEDTGFTATNQFDTTRFYEPIFNNSGKNNYTLKYDEINNPIAYALFSGAAIGAYQASANIICKDTTNSGDCDRYDITTDNYGLGLFAGITNVGSIDNTNEKLERTTDGANNWGVFVASSELPKTHIIKNFRAFGALIDRNGGQISKQGSDFAYNYQIDLLIKWSPTLTKVQLLADTSIPFVRLRLRSNADYNYYVNNSGNLVGDGEPTYAGLVNSSDSGSGSLTPIKIQGRSFVAIIILKDA